MKTEQIPSGKMHTQSLVIINFPCNPVLAGVKGPWGPVRDVLTQPPWAVPNRPSQFSSFLGCFSRLRPAAVRDDQLGGRLAWALEENLKREDLLPSSCLSISSADLF